MLDGTIKGRGGKPFRASTARTYGQLLNAYVVPAIGPRRLADVRHVDLLDLAADLERRGLAPSTVRNALDPVRVIFRRAVQRGELAANPAAGLELGGGDAKPRSRVADPAEAAALIEALARPTDRALWATRVLCRSAVRRASRVVLAARRPRHVAHQRCRVDGREGRDHVAEDARRHAHGAHHAASTPSISWRCAPTGSGRRTTTCSASATARSD
jgi:hypothetical protein